MMSKITSCIAATGSATIESYTPKKCTSCKSKEKLSPAPTRNEASPGNIIGDEKPPAASN